MTLPIVFLHAFPFDATMWTAQLDAVAGRRALAPDFPGFGGKPVGPPTLDDFARSVIADLDDAGIDRAIFAGLSMGGYVAFRLWAHWPERIAGLVLADTRAGPDGDEARQRRTDQAARVRDEGVGWFADSLVPGVLGETTRQERPDVVQWVRDSVARADPEGVARALVAMRDRPDSSDLLAGIHVPVLALVGSEDELTPADEARKIAAGVPDGALQILSGVGHLSNLEDPPAFDAALTSFLDRPAFRR